MNTKVKINTVEMPSRFARYPDVFIIDGFAILRVVHWPNKEVSKTVPTILSVRTDLSDVYLVFDWYHNYSIKNGARPVQAGQFDNRCYQLSQQTPPCSSESCSDSD